MRHVASAIDSVFSRVEEYYAAKLARHGATPRGVDWSCLPTQELRFAHLLRLCDFGQPFSLDDLGCGYGGLVAYLEQYHQGAAVDYLGIDLSPAMIRAARRSHPQNAMRRFFVGHESPRIADYAVASGIMNVKLHHSADIWEVFVAATLRGMWRATRCGFAVNFLRPLQEGVDHPELYRTEPARWASFCAAELGCSVEVVAEYGLREFTLLARHCGNQPGAA